MKQQQQHQQKHQTKAQINKSENKAVCVLSLLIYKCRDPLKEGIKNDGAFELWPPLKAYIYNAHLR